LPVFARSKTKKKPNPSEYPNLVLKALLREYDSNLEVRNKGLSETILVVKAGIVKDYEEDIGNNKRTYGDFVSEMKEVLRVLEDQQYITLSPYLVDRFVKPTAKGIDHARWLMRPGYQKVWDYLKGDIRTAIISVIASLLTALLTYGILRLLGWL